MQPLGDKVLIKPWPAEEISKGGIHIPDSAKKRPGKGTLIFISKDIEFPEGHTIPKEGDSVLVNPEAGAPVIYNEEDLLMITYPDIWAIL